MPRKLVSERKKGVHTKEQMSAALRRIEGGLSMRAAAKEIGISYHTVRRYHMKSKDYPNPILTSTYDHRRFFSEQQENSLKSYITYCANIFYGITAIECRKLAFQLASINEMENIPPTWKTHSMAGLDWLRGFRGRHPELTLKKPEACSLARATSFNKTSVEIFFDNLHNVLQRHPEFSDGTRIFNLDETATTTVQKPQKVLATKNIKNLSKVTSGERGVLVTTCCIISASGTALPPIIVFPRKNFKSHMINGAPPGSLGLATPSGWMNSEIFVEVMKHFIKNTNSSITNPSLLIMDNHESHLAIQALNLAKDSGVTVLTFHPHTTAKMQPLDVGVFGPFKKFYNSEMDSVMLRMPGQPITIYHLAEIIGKAFQRAMTPSNISNAFKKTGIFPFDRHVFTDEHFLPSSVTDRPDLSATMNDDLVHAVPLDQQEIETSASTNDVDTNRITTEHQYPHCSTELPQIDEEEQEQPHCSKSKTFLSPFDFRQPIKAGPRKNGRKRTAGRSLIATDTPEKNQLAAKKKQVNNVKITKNPKRKVLQSSDSDTDTSLQLDDSDCSSFIASDQEDSLPNSVELNYKYLDRALNKIPEINNFVVVTFKAKKLDVCYVGKILEPKNIDNEWFISFLRLKSKAKELFCMPQVPDFALVKDSDIKYVLSDPTVSGATKRQQSLYKFVESLGKLNIR